MARRTALYGIIYRTAKLKFRYRTGAVNPGPCVRVKKLWVRACVGPCGKMPIPGQVGNDKKTKMTQKRKTIYLQ